jgi:TusA-related sulfurtransferase
MKVDATLDLKGLICPVPILKTSQKIKTMNAEQILEVLATDEGVKYDFPAWCKSTGHKLISIEEETEIYKIYIKKSL